MALKYNDLCIDIRKLLLAAQDGNPYATAQELVCAASGKSREELLRDYGLYVPAEIESAAMALCRRRAAGEPLAYILGQWDFMGLPLKVGPGALIPRDDTEIAATLAIEVAKAVADRGEEPRVLDLCCGSGCIGLAVAKYVPQARVVMADISEAALAVCHKNAQSLGLTLRAIGVKADALAKAPAFLGKFDVLVSNPPYVTTGEMETLDPSVRDFEPRLALDGGADGLNFYRSIAANWAGVLKPGGRLIFEMGIGQADAVLDILKSEGFGVIGVARDSQKIDRAVVAEAL